MVNIKPTVGKRIVLASDYLVLDTDVITGGGIDQTGIVQDILDKALDWGGLTLIMDGAVTVSGLCLHSNTTIRCLDTSCGFYLADHSSKSLITNADWDFDVMRNENITLIGGTYNFNRANQERYPEPGEGESLWIEGPDPLNYDYFVHKWSIGMRFFGVRNLLIRDATLLNQRTYAALFINWEDVLVENVSIPLPDLQYAENQDGLHFFGPGKNLVIRDINGCSGDDFIALTPDEWDGKSSITDVLIDGVCLKDADQGIRLLTKKDGRLDRVIIRNVYGTYKSCGFFINPWFHGARGNFGSITIENVDLRQTFHKYAAYSTPFLFRIGGNVDSLTIRNIKSIDPNDNRPLIEISHIFGHPDSAGGHVHVKNLTVDGLEVINRSGVREKSEFITVDGKVDNLIISHVLVDRKGNENDDSLVVLKDQADVGRLVLEHITINGIGQLLLNEGGKVHDSIIR